MLLLDINYCSNEKCIQFRNHNLRANFYSYAQQTNTRCHPLSSPSSRWCQCKIGGFKMISRDNDILSSIGSPWLPVIFHDNELIQGNSRMQQETYQT